MKWTCTYQTWKEALRSGWDLENPSSGSCVLIKRLWPWANESHFSSPCLVSKQLSRGLDKVSGSATMGVSYKCRFPGRSLSDSLQQVGWSRGICIFILSPWWLRQRDLLSLDSYHLWGSSTLWFLWASVTFQSFQVIVPAHETHLLSYCKTRIWFHLVYLPRLSSILISVLTSTLQCSFSANTEKASLLSFWSQW